MNTFLNSIPEKENISISNSVILNNYSINNYIIKKNHQNSYEQFPNNTGNIFIFNNKLENTLSPIDNKYNNKYNFINLQDNPKNKYATPIPSKKYSSKIKFLKINKTNLKKNYFIPKLFPITENSNPKKEENHPKDSIKKNIKNIFKNNLRNDKLNQNLKNSLSQGYFEKIKVYKGVLRNLSLENLPKKNLRQKPKSTLSKKKVPKNSKTAYKMLKTTKVIYKEPKKDLNLKEFQFGKQIGKGTYGNIFSVKWNKNNKYYAMKKEILYNIEEIDNRKKNCKIMQNFVKKTQNNGVTYIYGNSFYKNNNVNINNVNINNTNINNNIQNIINEYIYYELMEKAERDWDEEIIERSQNNNFYSEKEILDIMSQLISTLSLMQKNHITHRDIKPQNILIFKGKYKLCDFGEIRVLERAGLIVQRVRGSELYMSPILFEGLHKNLIQVKHNTYKSDVFSLGMCLFYACSLTYSGVDSIREIHDMKKIKKILFEYLNKRYSKKLILFILSMLEIDENKRYNFIQLEEKYKSLL